MNGDPTERRQECNQLLRASIDALARAEDYQQQRRERVAAIEAFLAEHGAAKLARLLQCGNLIDPSMGKGSQLAVRGANDHVEAELPCALVVKFDPRNKNAARRTDVRLLTGGSVQVSLDFGQAT